MKSKKTIAVLMVLAVMCCSTLFAAEAKKNRKSAKSTDSTVVTFTPAIGLSTTTATSSFGNISMPQFDLGFHAVMLGIPKVAKDSWLNNLTPMVNIDLGIGGKLSFPREGSNTDSKIKTTAVVFQMSALCGYTFKPVKNLYLTPAAGLGFSAGSVKTKETIKIFDETETREETYTIGTFSLPFFFGLKYFFTDLIGIELTLIDTLNFGRVLTSPFGSFQNTFVIKVGPTFRLGMKV